MAQLRQGTPALWQYWRILVHKAIQFCVCTFGRLHKQVHKSEEIILCRPIV